MDEYAAYIDNIVIFGDFNLEPDSKNENFEHLIDAGFVPALLPEKAGPSMVSGSALFDNIFILKECLRNTGNGEGGNILDKKGVGIEDVSIKGLSDIIYGNGYGVSEDLKFKLEKLIITTVSSDHLPIWVDVDCGKDYQYDGPYELKKVVNAKVNIVDDNGSKRKLGKMYQRTDL